VLSVLCALYFFNVWQSYRYTSVERETERMQARQMELFEENKRLIAGIALLESPDRIERLAQEQLGLEGPYEMAPLIIRLTRGPADRARHPGTNGQRRSAGDGPRTDGAGAEDSGGGR
jgi:cell division protein FtsL